MAKGKIPFEAIIKEAVEVKTYIKSCIKENKPIDESKINGRKIVKPLSWQVQ